MKNPPKLTRVVRGTQSAKRHNLKIGIGKPHPEDEPRIAALSAVARFSRDSLPKLAELARVPKAHRDAFWWDAGDRLLDCLLIQGYVHVNSELRKNVSFARAMSTLKSARQALGQIDESPREDFRGPIEAAEEGIDAFLTAFGELEAKRTHRRGRPRGKVQDPASHKFVFQFIECVVLHGGVLTFDKNIREGTLIDALRESAPYLPEGVHPDKLSSPNLQRIKDDASRAAREKRELLDQKFDNF
jgi:hypothetical protein